MGYQVFVPGFAPGFRPWSYDTDFYSGKVTKITDVDNNVFTSSNFDAFGRPTSVAEPGGKTVTTEYHDSKRYTTVTTTLDGTRNLFSVSRYDQIGRVWLEQTSEDGPFTDTDTNTSRGLKVVHRYSSSGGFRYQARSNPFRGGSPASPPDPVAEPTMGWTREKFDSAGRSVERASFPQAADPANAAASNHSTTNYPSTDSRVVCDEASNATTTANPGACRTYSLDALGRLVQVTEGAVATQYAYDHMGNLWTVTPPDAGRVRNFAYDGLGRLKSAGNPENGTIQYTYDDNGNLIDRVDAAGAHMCVVSATSTTCDGSVGYDVLNRPLRRNYTAAASTPSVTYAYDSVYKGRLSSVTSGSTAVSYTQYDTAGRVKQHTQTTDSHPYSFSYTYNSGGLLTSITYPSGRTVTTTYDASGRPNTLASTLASTATTYLQSAGYAPHGGVSQLWLGPQTVSGIPGGGHYENWTYNGRLQPVGLKLGPTPGSTSWLGVTLDYGGNGNNGNVLTQNISGQELTQPLAASYEYDSRNRLLKATERLGTTSGATSWYQYFGADDYGNGYMTDSYGLAQQPLRPASAAWFTSKNRIDRSVLTNFDYDGGSPNGPGNLTKLGGYTLSYDGENRLASSTIKGVTTAYVYDGDGRRVKRGGTTYVYDAFGNLAAEYGGAAAPWATQYLTADWLGSTRAVVANQALVERRDYAPYGDELPVTVGGRSALWGADMAVRQEFTGKERDAESGLDFFEARYLDSREMRFTTADPLNVMSGRLNDPQMFNLYTYGRNNPLRFIDPDGLDPVPVPCNSPTSGNCYSTEQELGEKAYEGRVAENGQAKAAEGPTIAALPLTTKRGQTRDRAIGAIKSALNDVLDVLGLLGAPDANLDQIRSTLNLYPASQNEEFGGRVLEIGMIFSGGGKTGRKVNQKAYEAAKEASDWIERVLKRVDSLPNKTPELRVVRERLKRALNQARDNVRKSEPHAVRGQGPR